MSDKERLNVGDIMVESMADEPKSRFIKLVQNKAGEIVDISFEFVIAMVILFLISTNCHLSLNGDKFNTQDTVQFSDITECDVGNTFRIENVEVILAIAIASYGIFTAVVVWIHVRYMKKDYGNSPVEGIYERTNRIPVIGTLLQVSIALIIAPCATMLLWVAFIAICGGLVLLIVKYHKTSRGDTGSFALTCFLIAFQIYKLTGKLSEYFIINKVAMADDEEKERIAEFFD